MIKQPMSVALINATDDVDVVELVTSAIGRKWADELSHDTDILLASLTEGARFLYLTCIADGQVSNGGYAQLYQNGYGRFSEDFVEAFDYFGAREHASLTRAANKVYDSNRRLIWWHGLRIASTLRRTLGTNSLSSKLPALDLLDSAFYEAEDELNVVRLAKIRNSPESFV